MNITLLQYYNDFDGTQIGIKATIDGTEMHVPLDPATTSACDSSVELHYEEQFQF